MAEDRTRIEVADHVATVTLTRADKHNALDRAMFEGIVEAATEVADTPGVRVVVLHGEGPSFCSGLDIASFLESDGNATNGGGLEVLTDRTGGRRANLAQRVATDWIDLPVPVIAAIHGACFGGGLQIALGADIRIAAPDAKLSVMEGRWGLVPDMGITQTLTRLVPIDVAKELTFTARRVSGEEARELGLVTRVADDPLAAARELAAEIAGRSPDAVRAAKRLYEETWPAPAGKALELETELQTGLIGSPNQMEAVMSGMKGEPAQFADPA
jgi:enoyl-CoA hydratase/carnithine racemase